MTPGTWEAAKGHEEWLVVAHDADDEVVVATCGTTDAEADARLIAAAPVMAAFLKDQAEWLEAQAKMMDEIAKRNDVILYDARATLREGASRLRGRALLARHAATEGRA